MDVSNTPTEDLTSVTSSPGPHEPGGSDPALQWNWDNSVKATHHAPSADSAAHARSHLPTARRVRWRHLAQVTLGNIDVREVLAAAATPPGRPLLRIRLRALLMAMPGVGRATADRQLLQLARIAGADPRDFNPNLSWLIDRRRGGRRYLALLDVLQPKTAPWPGYPWTAPPEVQ